MNSLTLPPLHYPLQLTPEQLGMYLDLGPYCNLSYYVVQVWVWVWVCGCECSCS